MVGVHLNGSLQKKERKKEIENSHMATPWQHMYMTCTYEVKAMFARKVLINMHLARGMKPTSLFAIS